MHVNYASNLNLPQNVANPSILQYWLPIQIDLKPLPSTVRSEHELHTPTVEKLAENTSAFNGGMVVLLLLGESASSQLLRYQEDQLHQDTCTDPPAHERWRRHR